ncbi:SCP2 sterol-binding domain-containing protein [Alkanindiges sp. WGS2144]|uniref:SCP2 sterol-binding domain-containing protein n=1 Tax=Alkanindiges sp. WGS2144 TaxID=3366808 RepID=UPI0037521777
MKLSSLPVIKLPIINVSTDPFDLLLVALGLRMQQLSKTSAKFIELLHGRRFTLQLESKNGVSRHFIIADEQVKMASGSAEKPDFTLRFEDSMYAVQTLLKGDPAAFMTGMQSGKIQMEGDFSLLMWFNQAAKLIAPTIPKPVMRKIKQIKSLISDKKTA